MRERVTNQYFVTMNTMNITITKDELSNIAKALISWLREKSQKKNWEYKLWIAGSMIDKKTMIKSKEVTNKKGRPKIIFLSNGKPQKKIVTPHLHMLIKCKPGETIMQGLKIYWNDRYINKEQPYKKRFFWEPIYCTIGAIDYMSEQSAFDRTNSFPKLVINDWDYICLQKSWCENPCKYKTEEEFEIQYNNIFIY